jgi:transposase-like protein
MDASITQCDHTSLDNLVDRPSTPEERARDARKLTALFDQCDTERDAISQPSNDNEVTAEPTGDVISETAAATSFAAGVEAVSLPEDPIAAGEPTDAAIQPRVDVAASERSTDAPDEDGTAAEEDPRRRDISGGQADGSPDSERPEVEGVNDFDAAGTPSPDDSEAGIEATSVTDEAGDKAEAPQPTSVGKLPKDFDWRKLTPRKYGQSLPPLDPSERQNLKASIESRGFFGKILIDELLNIIDGNTRQDICLETGIAPDVEVIPGLSDEEKEELALSYNVDRRQLKDPEVEKRVFEARCDNLLDARRKNKKKWTLQKIAETLGVSIATVSARRDLRHISDGENVSKEDARRKYDDELKREAVRLVKEGMSQAEVARKVLIHPRTLQRAVNKDKKRESGEDAAKGGKSEKAAATQSTEDLAANDGVPKVHQAALDRLGKNAHDYDDWLEDGFADALTDFKAVADSDEEVLKLTLRSGLLLALCNSRLKRNCGDGGEVDVEESPPGNLCPDGDRYKPGTILRGIVMDVGPDEVVVLLPDGRTGVIDNRDNRLAQYGPLEVGKAYRVRVEGFDPGRDLVIVLPQGLQTPAPYDRSTALGSDCDKEFTPDAEDAAGEADAEMKVVIA